MLPLSTINLETIRRACSKKGSSAKKARKYEEKRRVFECLGRQCDERRALSRKVARYQCNHLLQESLFLPFLLTFATYAIQSGFLFSICSDYTPHCTSSLKLNFITNKNNNKRWWLLSLRFYLLLPERSAQFHLFSSPSSCSSQGCAIIYHSINTESPWISSR